MRDGGPFVLMMTSLNQKKKLYCLKSPGQTMMMAADLVVFPGVA